MVQFTSDSQGPIYVNAHTVSYVKRLDTLTCIVFQTQLCVYVVEPICVVINKLQKALNEVTK
jgi:hypothetical protein